MDSLLRKLKTLSSAPIPENPIDHFRILSSLSHRVYETQEVLDMFQSDPFGIFNPSEEDEIDCEVPGLAPPTEEEMEEPRGDGIAPLEGLKSEGSHPHGLSAWR